MLNKVILMGRIANDLELKSTADKVSVLSFNVAVDRGFTKQGEERKTDFISCVAWRSQAEFISRYFSKGRMIALEGNLRTRTYDDKNGVKHYVTEVYVDSVSFTGEAKPIQDQKEALPAPLNKPDEFSDIEGFEELGNDEGTPF